MENITRLVNLIKNAGTFYFATNEDGQPRVRPFNAVMEFDGKVYFYTNNHKTAFMQMRNCPKIELCAVLDEDGDRWLRVSGDVIFDERVEAKQAMIEANPKLKSMYSASDKIFEVFFLDNVVAKIHSTRDAAEQIM